MWRGRAAPAARFRLKRVEPRGSGRAWAVDRALAVGEAAQMDEDVKPTQETQRDLLCGILDSDLNDPKLTQSGQKRASPGRKVLQGNS
jgi:hypothetical protein